MKKTYVSQDFPSSSQGIECSIRGARGVTEEALQNRANDKSRNVVRGFSLVHDPKGSHYGGIDRQWSGETNLKTCPEHS